MIERISFSNPNVPKRLTNTINFAEAEDTNLSQGKGMKEKSDAAKYMIGAAALAGVIAVGIIGHKNNWFSKVKDIDEDFLDFSKIKGEKLTKSVDVNEVFYVIQQKDKNGKLILEYISQDDKTLDAIIDYSPETGKMFKITRFQPDGKTLHSVMDFSPETGTMLKDTTFQPDGKRLYWVREYSPVTGRRLKDTKFREDGMTPDTVIDYLPETGKMFKITRFQPDGKTIVENY